MGGGGQDRPVDLQRDRASEREARRAGGRGPYRLPTSLSRDESHPPETRQLMRSLMSGVGGQRLRTRPVRLRPGAWPGSPARASRRHRHARPPALGRFRRSTWSPFGDLAHSNRPGSRVSFISPYARGSSASVPGFDTSHSFPRSTSDKPQSKSSNFVSSMSPLRNAAMSTSGIGNGLPRGGIGSPFFSASISRRMRTAPRFRATSPPPQTTCPPRSPQVQNFPFCSTGSRYRRIGPVPFAPGFRKASPRARRNSAD